MEVSFSSSINFVRAESMVLVDDEGETVGEFREETFEGGDKVVIEFRGEKFL